jgi:hypothetical protein
MTVEHVICTKSIKRKNIQPIGYLELLILVYLKEINCYARSHPD